MVGTLRKKLHGEDFGTLLQKYVYANANYISDEDEYGTALRIRMEYREKGAGIEIDFLRYGNNCIIKSEHRIAKRNRTQVHKVNLFLRNKTGNLTGIGLKCTRRCSGFGIKLEKCSIKWSRKSINHLLLSAHFSKIWNAKGNRYCSLKWRYLKIKKLLVGGLTHEYKNIYRIFMCKEMDRPKDMEGDEDLLSGSWCGHTSLPPAPPAEGDVEAMPVVPPPTDPTVLKTQFNSYCVNPGQGQNNRTSVATTTGSSASSEQDPGTFGRGYQQCKSARREARSSEAVELSGGANYGTVTNITAEPIGNMDLVGDGMLYKTFRGSRVSSKGQIRQGLGDD